jgi:hypothetical protein
MSTPRLSRPVEQLSDPERERPPVKITIAKTLKRSSGIGDVANYSGHELRTLLLAMKNNGQHRYQTESNLRSIARSFGSGLIQNALISHTSAVFASPV